MRCRRAHPTPPPATPSSVLWPFPTPKPIPHKAPLTPFSLASQQPSSFMLYTLQGIKLHTRVIINAEPFADSRVYRSDRQFTTVRNGRRMKIMFRYALIARAAFDSLSASLSLQSLRNVSETLNSDLNWRCEAGMRWNLRDFLVRLCLI